MAATDLLRKLARAVTSRVLESRRRQTVERLRDAALERQFLAAHPDPNRRRVGREEILGAEVRLLRRAVALGCERQALEALHPESRAARIIQDDQVGVVPMIEQPASPSPARRTT